MTISYLVKFFLRRYYRELENKIDLHVWDPILSRRLDLIRALLEM